MSFEPVVGSAMIGAFATGDGAVKVWGQMDDGETVWDQVPAPGVSVEIKVNRSAHRVAPEGAFFSVVLSGFDTNTDTQREEYDPSYHDKVYFWDFGESYTFAAPTQVAAMDAADGGGRTNSRYGRGPLGAHVFRTPGRHQVRLAVLEPSSGKWGQGRFTVSVGDPETFYSGATTLFVDQLGLYANAPPGARGFRSLMEAFSVLSGARTPHRIVLERGQTHVISNTWQFRPPSGAAGVSLRLEAREGEGARPVIAASGNFSGETMISDRSLRRGRNIDTGAVIKGLRIQGTWDVRTETGRWDLSGINFGSDSGRHAVVDDCEITNLSKGIRTINVARGTRNTYAYFINDTVISDWSDYGVFDPDSGYTAVLGSRIAQNPDARTGGPKNDRHNNHGPVRMARPNRTVFASCDLFSATGWSGLSNILAIQPAVRWNTSPRMSGAQLNIQACAMECPRVTIELNAANRNSPSRLVNALIEGSIFVAGFQAPCVVRLSHGGITFRNNLFIYPNVDFNSKPIGGQRRSPDRFIEAAQNGFGNGTDRANLAAPIMIYNNTLVNLSDQGEARLWSDTVMGFRSVTIANNLMHQPAMGSAYPQLRDIPAFRPRYKGYRIDENKLFDEFATPPDSASLWVPDIGSPALGAALTGQDASADFEGNLRPEPPSIGAFEAD